MESAVDTLIADIAPAASGPVVVLIDGRSGAGKSTVASRLIARWPGPVPVQFVALDSLYPGWDGLAAGAAVAREGILVPHARGAFGAWRRWDWEKSVAAEEHVVAPALPLIVEGVGILTAHTAALADVRVWLDSPESSRRRRALERDGDAYRPYWDRWAAQEEEHIRRDAPRTLATHVFEIP